MKKYENVVTNFSGIFPNALAINSTGAATPNGSEFVAGYINNFVIGICQAVMNYAGITPDGITEAAGASQFLEAMQKGAALLPGLIFEWNLNIDPAVIGFRGFLLSGQGIVRANYTDLDTNNYVGDANNAAVAAVNGGWYRADDAEGVTPNITGAYLILPESRGYTTRGLDVAASVDPGGASRYLGDTQIDAMQKITGGVNDERIARPTTDNAFIGAFVDGPVTALVTSRIAAAGNQLNFDNSASVSPNPAKTNDFETRMSNRSTKYVVIY